MEIPKNEGAIHNKGRAFIEYNTIKEAKTVYCLFGIIVKKIEFIRLWS